MTMQGVGEALVASRTGARKGLPYMRTKLVSVVIASDRRERGNLTSDFGHQADGFETAPAGHPYQRLTSY